VFTPSIHSITLLLYQVAEVRSSFDKAQDEREIIQRFPFVPTVEARVPFFSDLLA
jgi:hypothetical protein